MSWSFSRSWDLRVRLPHGLQNVTYSRLYGSQARPSSSQFTGWVTRLYYTKLKHLKNWDCQASGKPTKKNQETEFSEFSRGSKNYMLLSSLHIPKWKSLSSCFLSSWWNRNSEQDPLGEKGAGWNHKLFITGCCGNQKLNGIQKKRLDKFMEDP